MIQLYSTECLINLTFACEKASFLASLKEAPDPTPDI